MGLDLLISLSLDPGKIQWDETVGKKEFISFSVMFALTFYGFLPMFALTFYDFCPMFALIFFEFNHFFALTFFDFLCNKIKTIPVYAVKNILHSSV